jgi:hypothetical protein
MKASIRKDELLELACAKTNTQDYFSKEGSSVSLVDVFSMDLLDGGDLFAKDNTFRDASESNNFEGDFSETSFNFEWDAATESFTQTSSKPRRRITGNKLQSGRLSSRVRRLSVAPAADTAPPQFQATKATPKARRTSLAILSKIPNLEIADPHRVRESISSIPIKVSKSPASLRAGSGGRKPQTDTTIAHALQDKRSKSEGRSTRIRNIIDSQVRTPDANRVIHSQGVSTEAKQLSRSVHGCKTQRCGSAPQFKKSNSDKVSASSHGSKQTVNKIRSTSTGPLRSNRMLSNSSDTSNTTHDLSNSTDSRNSSKVADEVLYDSDDESSVEDIFESPPQRRKKSVLVNRRFVETKARNPQGKVDGLSARTDHYRSSRRSSTRSHTKDSGSLSDGGMHRSDHFPRAPERQRSMEYDDFVTMREAHAKERSQTNNMRETIRRKPAVQRVQHIRRAHQASSKRQSGDGIQVQAK